MPKVRRIAVSVVLPLVYAVAVLVVTRHPKPVYAFADPTVFNVTEQAGPQILHTVNPVYPAIARRKGIEGSVRFKVTIAADGSVTHAEYLSGPAPLVNAALIAVRQWQFEAKKAETEIEIPFTLPR
jgi:TonB family protein